MEAPAPATAPASAPAAAPAQLTAEPEEQPLPVWARLTIVAVALLAFMAVSLIATKNV